MNKEKEKQELACPACGFKAKSADEMQKHMQERKDDPAHVAYATRGGGGETEAE